MIFEQLPKSSQVGEPHLSLAHLFERGRTVQFADLPERLWAAAGVRLENADRYQEFGRLRNAVQHFVTPTKRDVASETSHFIYGVIDPFIHECWGLYAADYCEDSEGNEYLLPTLVQRGVKFLVSPTTAKSDPATFEWPAAQPGYREEMERRFLEARRNSNIAT